MNEYGVLNQDQNLLKIVVTRWQQRLRLVRGFSKSSIRRSEGGVVTKMWQPNNIRSPFKNKFKNNKISS
jgi:hypothetical protein